MAMENMASLAFLVINSTEKIVKLKSKERDPLLEKQDSCNSNSYQTDSQPELKKVMEARSYIGIRSQLRLNVLSLQTQPNVHITSFHCSLLPIITSHQRPVSQLS